MQISSGKPKNAGVRACVPLVALCAFSELVPAAAGAAAIQSTTRTWTDDPFAAGLAGKWDGVGEYDGNELQLTRSWEIDLGGHFLRGDMRVLMPNGASFRALTYWRKVDPARCGVTWMDESGRHQTLAGLVSNNGREIEIQHLEAGPAGPPGWRRTVYTVLSRDSYRERIYGMQGNDWVQLAEFRFRRVGGETDANPTGSPPKNSTGPRR